MHLLHLVSLLFDTDTSFGIIVHKLYSLTVLRVVVWM